jgi:hypothetical protein
MGGTKVVNLGDVTGVENTVCKADSLALSYVGIIGIVAKSGLGRLQRVVAKRPDPGRNILGLF